MIWIFLTIALKLVRLVVLKATHSIAATVALFQVGGLKHVATLETSKAATHTPSASFINGKARSDPRVVARHACAITRLQSTVWCIVDLSHQFQLIQGLRNQLGHL